MRVKIGAFSGIQNFDKISNAGYNSIELDSVEIASLSECNFEAFREKAVNCQIAMDVFARALPYDTAVIGNDNFNKSEFLAYIKLACRRLGKLGAKKLIFGNGKARTLPLRSRSSAEKELHYVVRMLCEAADENDIAVLLEPLGPHYTNYINTIEEAVTLCDALKLNNLFTMCDLRHMVASADSFDAIKWYASYIKHIHVDNPLTFPERHYPRLTDKYDYNPFFDALKSIQYSGSITIEAQIPDSFQKELAESHKFFAHYDILLV